MGQVERPLRATHIPRANSPRFAFHQGTAAQPEDRGGADGRFRTARQHRRGERQRHCRADRSWLQVTTMRLWTVISHPEGALHC